MSLAEVGRHLQSHLGEAEGAYHPVADAHRAMHVDVYHIANYGPENYHVLATSGMSSKALDSPHGMLDCAYAELVMVLPESWGDELASRGPVGEPIEATHLRESALFPRESRVFVWEGHTIQTGQIRPDTEQAGFALLRTSVFPDDFWVMDASSSERFDQDVHFFQLVPLYPSELELAQVRSTKALQRRLRSNGHGDGVVDYQREAIELSVMDRLLGIFGI